MNVGALVRMGVVLVVSVIGAFSSVANAEEVDVFKQKPVVKTIVRLKNSDGDEVAYLPTNGVLFHYQKAKVSVHASFASRSKAKFLSAFHDTKARMIYQTHRAKNGETVFGFYDYQKGCRYVGGAVLGKPMRIKSIKRSTTKEKDEFTIVATFDKEGKEEEKTLRFKVVTEDKKQQLKLQK